MISITSHHYSSFNMMSKTFVTFKFPSINVGFAACYSQANHHMLQMLEANTILEKTAEYNRFDLVEATSPNTSVTIQHGTTRVQHESRRIQFCQCGKNKSNRALEGAYPFQWLS